MIKRLTSLGNSAALIIDKPILDLLHITPQTDLSITTDGKSLTISPLGVLTDEKFKAAHDQVLKRHHNTFKKLANPDK